MTLTSDEVTRVRSLHVRLDMAEVEEIYLPLSRLLSLYVAATQRLFRAQQNFLGTEDSALPWRAGRMFRRSISSPLAAFSIPTSFSSANA